WLGTTTVLLGSAAGVGLIRLVLQLWPGDSVISYGLGAAGILLLIVYLPAQAATIRSPQGGWQFALGIAVAGLFDVLLKGMNGGVDLSWTSGWPGLILLGLLWLGQLYCWWQVRQERPAGGAIHHPWPWLGLGPFFFMYFLVWQNDGRLNTLSGWAAPVTFLWLTIMMLLGLALVYFAPRLVDDRRMTAGLAAAVLLLSQFPTWPTGLLAVIFAALGYLSGLMLLTIALTGLAGSAAGRQSRGLTGPHGVSMLLLVLLIFIYYAGYDLPLPFPNSSLPVIAALVLGLAGLLAPPLNALPEPPQLARIWSLSLLLLLPLYGLINYEAPRTTPSSTDTIRFMTYNVHNGFDKDGNLNLEGIAQTIEAAGPVDMVALQEVSRGWLVNGSIDMVSWLARRLEMEVLFAPNADPLIGIAILSRRPITASGTAYLPPAGLLFERSYLWVDITIGGSSYRLINIHAHHLADGSEIRQEEITALLAFWADQPQTIIAGDFNATAETPEIGLLRAAGFQDVQELAGGTPAITFPDDEGGKRLDYIWLS
ncbi:MAG: endonuclease/exonuclease/phosphatase family protein, partial [Anaerolineales bacterium]|nr:endonuclease/exonuclease/phosphatase family protein [Anaerolineales bacterium]